jgi:branched-chain amino acid aminotransferase
MLSSLRIVSLAIVDGSVLDSMEAVFPLVDDGLWRGDGVFEVIRLYGGRPWALDEHMERMALGARNLRLAFSPARVVADVATLLAQAGPVDAFLRIAVTRGGRCVGLIEALDDPPESIALATVEHAPSKLMDAIKSFSYAANMLAGRLAREQGADDALFVTPHGRVLESPRASFFYVLGERLHTPPLDGHVLDSITRRHLLGLTDATERITRREDLRAVSEAFLASTVKEVLPVRAIDGRRLADTPGPVTALAASALRDRIAAMLATAS